VVAISIRFAKLTGKDWGGQLISIPLHVVGDQSVEGSSVALILGLVIKRLLLARYIVKHEQALCIPMLDWILQL
jgi:hypothetical protein